MKNIFFHQDFYHAEEFCHLFYLLSLTTISQRLILIQGAMREHVIAISHLNICEA